MELFLIYGNVSFQTFQNQEMKYIPDVLKILSFISNFLRLSPYVLTFTFIILLFLYMRKIQHSVLTYETLLYYEPRLSQDKIIPGFPWCLLRSPDPGTPRSLPPCTALAFSFCTQTSGTGDCSLCPSSAVLCARISRCKRAVRLLQ